MIKTWGFFKKQNKDSVGTGKGKIAVEDQTERHRKRKAYFILEEKITIKNSRRWRISLEGKTKEHIALEQAVEKRTCMLHINKTPVEDVLHSCKMYIKKSN